MLLEVLSDFQISIPELGVIEARTHPIVVLTSNNSRELTEALKRRCLYLWLDYPEIEREMEIVRLHAPELDERLARRLVEVIHMVRALDLKKPPSIAESIDWARALLLLGADDIDRSLFERTMSIIVKHRTDIDLVAERVGVQLRRRTARRGGSGLEARRAAIGELRTWSPPEMDSRVGRGHPGAAGERFGGARPAAQCRDVVPGGESRRGALTTQRLRRALHRRRRAVSEGRCALELAGRSHEASPNLCRRALRSDPLSCREAQNGLEPRRPRRRRGAGLRRADARRLRSAATRSRLGRLGWNAAASRPRQGRRRPHRLLPRSTWIGSAAPTGVAITDNAPGMGARHRSAFLASSTAITTTRSTSSEARPRATCSKRSCPTSSPTLLQYRYDAVQDAWMYESTADWAASQVFPDPRYYAVRRSADRDHRPAA